MALRRLGVGGLWLGVFGFGVGRCLGVAICVGRNWGLGLEWSLLFYFPLDLILWSLWCWLWWVVLGGVVGRWVSGEFCCALGFGIWAMCDLVFSR